MLVVNKHWYFEIFETELVMLIRHFHADIVSYCLEDFNKWCYKQLSKYEWVPKYVICICFVVISVTDKYNSTCKLPSLEE